MPKDTDPVVLPSNRRVLLVDDDATYSELLTEVLTNAGHEVLAVVDGEAALLEVKSFNPDLAIIDIGLPGIDGYELARRIRECVARKLVALSGFGADSAPPDTAVTRFDHHLVNLTLRSSALPRSDPSARSTRSSSSVLARR